MHEEISPILTYLENYYAQNKFYPLSIEKKILNTKKFDEIKYFKDLDTLISKYHKKLYSKHTHRKIEKYKNFYYINGYENDTIKILNIYRLYIEMHKKQ